MNDLNVPYQGNEEFYRNYFRPSPEYVQTEIMNFYNDITITRTENGFEAELPDFKPFGMYYNEGCWCYCNEDGSCDD